MSEQACQLFKETTWGKCIHLLVERKELITEYVLWMTWEDRFSGKLKLFGKLQESWWLLSGRPEKHSYRFCNQQTAPELLSDWQIGLLLQKLMVLDTHFSQVQCALNQTPWKRDSAIASMTEIAQQQPYHSGRIPLCEHVLNTCWPVTADHLKIHHHLFWSQHAIFHTVGAFDFVTKGCRDLFPSHCVTKPPALVWGASVVSQELQSTCYWWQSSHQW